MERIAMPAKQSILPAFSAIAVILGTSLLAAPAYADESCRAHYTFDGNLNDTGGNGYNGSMIAAEGAAPKANFAEGKYGQALVLDGSGAMTASIDLNSEACPFITFTAWIRAAEGRSDQTEYLVSTGSHITPGMYLQDEDLTLHGSNYGKTLKGAARPAAGWTFIAGVYDHVAPTFRLHVGTRNISEPLAIMDQPQPMLWVGAFNDDVWWPVSGIAIDDLRIYDRALSIEEVEAVRKNGGPAPGAGAFVPAQAGDWEGRSCVQHSDCGAGDAYCAFDNTCHPNSHLPRQQFELAVVDQPVNAVLPVIPAAEDPPASGAANTGPQRTGGPIIGNIAGNPGKQEYTFELSSGFLRSIAFDVYDGCAVKLNDETFSFCSRASSATELRASLPDAHVSGIRVCVNGSGPLDVIRGIEISGDTQRADGSYWNQVDPEGSLTMVSRPIPFGSNGSS